MNDSNPDHFAGKSPYDHVLTKKSEVASEVHGDELPGHTSALLDACRDTCILFLVIATIAFTLNFSQMTSFKLLLATGLAWVVWKTIRVSWSSWSMLERLHRVLKEEQHEIETNREQEREELTALYVAKGLKGDLLKEVINVLMADDDRLLKVMMEEEMGLNLEHYEHPLKIGLGAALGSLFSGVLLLLSFSFLGFYAVVIAAIVIKSIAGAVVAHLQKNEILSTLVWNIGACVLVGGMSYFFSMWMNTWL